jgi:hypothetical protein
MKGAGYKSNNSGESRGIIHACHKPTLDSFPLWAYLEEHGWTRIEAKGEWELRRYQRKGEVAIFHVRANGNLVTSGHSERLTRGFFHSLRERHAD